MKDVEKLSGNVPEYSVENTAVLENSPIKGKRVCFLGSSVTLGAASLSESFADFSAKRHGLIIQKHAVNGTTLTDIGEKSYVSRMKKIAKTAVFDLFVCQLSTNDAYHRLPIGEASDTEPTSVCGAINYIISYVSDTWGCPIVFYTGSYYENKNYIEMAEKLMEIKKLRGIGVIDLFFDKGFNNIEPEVYRLYMNDPVHPTRAGYREWWTPKFEEYFIKVL